MTMSITIPENVDYGTVVGRFLLAVADGPDADQNPDGQAATGTITFVPSVTHILNLTATPPVTIIAKPVVCTLDTEGYLVGPDGQRGVKLIATDDPDLNPTGWTYNVTYTLTGVKLASHALLVPLGQVTELTAAIRPASSTGIGLAQAEALAAQAQQDAAAAQAAVLVATDLRDQTLSAQAAAESAAALVGAPADDAVVTLLSGPTVTRRTLDATYARPLTNTFVIIGPSLEEQIGQGPDTLDASGGSACRARGWFHWARGMLDGAINLVRNAGVGGNRYDQMLARFTTDVLTYDSDWVAIGSPTNDVTAGRTTAQILTDLHAMIDLAHNDGRRVMVHGIPPRETFTSAALRTVVAEVNAHIADLAWTRPGVVPVDTWTPLANAATGDPLPGTTVDGTHYSIAGAARLGKATADALRNHIVPRPIRSSSKVDPKSVITDPGFTDGAATWTAAGVTATYTPARDGYGNKAVLTVAGNTSATAIRSISHSQLLAAGRFAPGDVIQGSVRVKWSDLVPLTGGTATSCEPILHVRHMSGGAIAYTAVDLFTATSEWVTDVTAMPTSGEMVLVTWKSTIGPTIDALTVILGWRGAASVTLEFDRLAVVKV